MTQTNRNAPCPCGSGKKYKICHGTTDQTRSGMGSWKIPAIVVGVLVLGGGAIALNHFRTADLSAGAAGYDADNDRYWNSAHGHWHKGRPDSDQGKLAPASKGRTPEPYEYDVPTDHYWDPVHGHWHEGSPPPEFAPPAIEGAKDMKRVSAEEAQRILAAQVTGAPADPTKTAWAYDAENDRHWNPNTQDWAPGMPPLEAFTSGAN